MDSRAPSGFLLVAGLVCSGCALGSSPQLYHPTPANTLGYYFGYSLPIQPASARITNPLTAARDDTLTLRSQTGVLPPLSAFGYSGLVFDPKLAASVGVTHQLTAAGEVGWHRFGFSLDYFTHRDARRGNKFAIGFTRGHVVKEMFGWGEVGWLSSLSEDFVGYLGVGVSAGRYRHFFALPNSFDSKPRGEDTMTFNGFFADVWRNEFRLRVPIGTSLRRPQKRDSVNFTAIPYATVAHGRMEVVSCGNCGKDFTFETFRQYAGLELQIGFQY
jgi:hypothetical protein